MNQISRVCVIADHNEKQIEYACVYPECNLKRFACGKCIKIGIHKHQQNIQSHILDNKELFEFLSQKLNNFQRGQDINNEQEGEYQTNLLNQITKEIKNLLENILNMIDQMKSSKKQNYNVQILNEILLKLKDEGFNRFDETQLNMLMFIDKQFGEISTQISKQSNQFKMQSEYKSCANHNKYTIVKYCNKLLIHNLITQDQVEGQFEIFASAISNDFKYIVCGGTEKKLKIWNYNNNTLIKSIQQNKAITYIKFTEDSKLLYVGGQQYLIQFDVNKNFNEIYKQSLHQLDINCIYCLTNTIILTASSDSTIMKTEINAKQQLFLINTNGGRICGLDYNYNLNIIVSCDDWSIKLWDGNQGQLVLQKLNIHENQRILLNQVLFIKKNQLISTDSSIIIIWNISYETKELVQLQQISDINQIQNIQLVLNQQYLILVCREYIKIYSIKGDYIKTFNHDVKEFYSYNVYQPQSMKAIIIQGIKILQICKVELD